MPALDLLVAVQAHQAVELRVQRGRVLREVGVVLHQQPHPVGARQRQRDAGRGAHGIHQRRRHPQLADLLAFRFDEHGTGGIELAQAIPYHRFKRFLGGLRLAGQAAQHGAAVGGQLFQVEHLRAVGVQHFQQAALAAARGAADDPERQRRRQLQRAVDVIAEGLVAAVQLRHGPAYLGQDVGQ